jgi:hypothetical protein
MNHHTPQRSRPIMPVTFLGRPSILYVERYRLSRRRRG